MFRPLLLVTWVCLAQSTFAQGLGRGTAEAPVMAWPVADPDSLGLDIEALEEHRQLCETTRASVCLVAWRGEIVQEWYAPGFPGEPVETQPWIGLRSATKSIAGLLTGLLVDDGRIRGVDEPVSALLPEWTSGAAGGVTLRHLLTMTSGVARNPEGIRGPGVVAAKDVRSFALQLDLEATPGEKWQYSNEGAQLLSPLLEKAAGMPLAAFAYERLFAPLGMESSYMMVDPYLTTVTIGGMRTRAREFARIGQLLLNDGQWNGTQILSPEWIGASFTGVEQNPFYGYLWWVDAENGVYSAAGSLDQVLYVIPEADLVAVRLQRDIESGRTGWYWGPETGKLLKRVAAGL